MGFKSGILIGKGLIYTILSSFVVLICLRWYFTKSIFGLNYRIAMGMLVDNAIVVVDGILVDLESRNGDDKQAMTKYS